MDKKYTVFDLFAGAGGFGLGFSMAGFDVRLSLEKDAWAVETLKENKPKNSIVIQDNIRNFNSKEKIIEVCQNIKPDIIIGGPPCQGFSWAGPTKDPNDPRNTLFQDFARWVEVLSPSIFIIENVSGLLNRKNSEGDNVIKIITSTFEKIGYKVNIWKLNAALFGVPQVRNRIFLVGNKFGSEISSPIQTHFLTETELNLNFLKPAISVNDAIGDLPQIQAGQGNEVSSYNMEPFTEFQKWARKNNSILHNHVAMVHTKRIVNRFQSIQSGLNIEELPENLKVLKRNGNGEISSSKYQSNYRHLKSNMISYTIPASFYSNFIHPYSPRNITSREAARIQSFPDNYIFKGKRTQISSKLLKQLGKESEDCLSQYNQIGNAVPPLLAFNIANKILNFLNSYLENND
jgi:DNA (cytosine-5)-methyltransferase 1